MLGRVLSIAVPVAFVLSCAPHLSGQSVAKVPTRDTEASIGAGAGIGDSWHPDQYRDRLTGQISNWMATSVKGDAGGEFEIRAYCSRTEVLGIYIHSTAGAGSPQIASGMNHCTSVRYKVGSNPEMETKSCRSDGALAIVFLPDLEQQEDTNANLLNAFVRVFEPGGPQSESDRRWHDDLSRQYQNNQALKDMTAAAGRVAGLLRIDEVAAADSIRVEVPMTNLENTIVEVDPQDPAFKNYVAGCMTPKPPSRPVPLAPAIKPVSAVISELATLKGEDGYLFGKEAAPAQLSGTADAIAAQIPQAIRDAAVARGLEPQPYTKDSACAAYIVRTCSRISKKMVKDATDKNMVFFNLMGGRYPDYCTGSKDVSELVRPYNGEPRRHVTVQISQDTPATVAWNPDLPFALKINFAPIPSDDAKTRPVVAHPTSTSLNESMRNGQSFYQTMYGIALASVAPSSVKNDTPKPPLHNPTADDPCIGGDLLREFTVGQDGLAIHDSLNGPVTETIPAGTKVAITSIMPNGRIEVATLAAGGRSYMRGFVSPDFVLAP
jgi:hypothetical protein